MKKLLSAERRHNILTKLAKDNFASIEDLGRMLHVSAATVRRDLESLEKEECIQRVHGGVVSTGLAGLQKIVPLLERQKRFMSEKEVIGRKAASLVEDREVVLLDGGTTTYEVAKHLTGKRVQIITNSLPIADLFANAQDVELLLIGGTLYPGRGVFLGPFAEDAVRKIWVQKAFIGVSGITTQGIVNTDLQTVQLQKAILERAAEVIVLADHSKWNMRGTYSLCPLSRIHRIVSNDAPLNPDLKNALVKNNVQVIIGTS